MVLALPRHMRNNKQHVAQSRSVVQEKDRAKQLGAKRVPMSGAGDTKGDVRMKNVVRMELKTTQAKSFSVSREIISKIENAALTSNEIPAIEVEFIDRNGKPECSVCIVPTYIIEMLMELKR